MAHQRTLTACVVGAGPRPAQGEHRAGEERSLTQGTAGWARLGQQVGLPGSDEVTR